MQLNLAVAGLLPHADADVPRSRWQEGTLKLGSIAVPLFECLVKNCASAGRIDCLPKSNDAAFTPVPVCFRLTKHGQVGNGPSHWGVSTSSSRRGCCQQHC